MKVNKLLGIFFLIMTCVGLHAQKIKVACVGNSITYGYLVVNREKNCYPAQLQRYLGDGFEVGNFGVSSTTLLKNADRPYCKTSAYQRSLAFEPDIVLIKLGTNDSKENNRHLAHQYKDDYRSLVESYQNLPSKPRVILLTPTKNYLSGKGIDNHVLQSQFTPQILQLAYEENLEVIDLYHVMGESFDPSILPDKLHPSPIGMNMLAKHIYQYLSVDRKPRQQITMPNDAELYNYSGYKGFRFKQKGTPYRIITPHIAAKGMPWIWRSSFDEKLLREDIILLESGFHIVYCGATDCQRDKISLRDINRLYKWMTNWGCSEKVVIDQVSSHTARFCQWIKKYPKRIVSFSNIREILRAVGVQENMCCKAASGFEYRSGAGWKEGADWHAISEEISQVVSMHKKLDLLLLGNSITQGFGGNRNLVTYKPGLKAATDIFQSLKWESAGISGDRVENLIWRVENGGYERANPQHVVITIGVNNLFSGKDLPRDVAEGIVDLVTKSSERYPKSKIILFGMLPAGFEQDDPLRIKCEEVHHLLADYDWKDVIYYNPTPHFTTATGHLEKSLYSGDNLHLSEQGYKVWAELIYNLVK